MEFNNDQDNDDDDINNSLIENIEDINGVKIYLNELMKNVNETTLNNIRHSFEQKINNRLNARELHYVLKPYNIILSDKDLNPMFAKIDVKKEGTINFLQFVAYLSFEFEKKRKHKYQNANEKLKLTLLTNEFNKDDNKSQYEIKGIVSKSIVIKPQLLLQSEYVAFNTEQEIVFYSPDFKWKSTYKLRCTNKTSSDVTGILVLSNYNIVCVSTHDKNLQFYHSTSDAFELRLTIKHLPAFVTCLAHSYNNYEPIVGIGDKMGNVIVIIFSRANELFDVVQQRISKIQKKNSASGGMLTSKSYNYSQIVTIAKRQGTTTRRSFRRTEAMVRAIQFSDVHYNQVELLEFVDSGKLIVSTSSAPRKSMAYCYVEISDEIISSHAPRYVTSADGLHCLCMCAVGDTIVATGYSDSVVRLWDIDGTEEEHSHPATTTKCTELVGHVAAVSCVLYNETNRWLYSVTVDCVIKVWDVCRTACLVTFHEAANVTSGGLRASSFLGHFNQIDQMIVIVTGMTILTIKCGDTYQSQHDTAVDSKYLNDAVVVKTMYNSLFDVLITVSDKDSTVCVWNPCNGESIIKWSMAHTKVVYGEVLPVEITAANFDPSGGLLVTGAANGTVHLWDPNDGTCLNRLQIPSKSRISEVVWLPNRILVTASDKQVTEFNEPLTVEKFSSGKVWLWRHDEAVLSACVKPPSLFVTTSSAGEMGFWRLETGKLVKKHKARMKPDKNRGSSKYSKSSMSSSKFSSISSSYMSTGSQFNPLGGDTETREEMFKRLDIKFTPREHYAAVASYFLRGRTDGLRVGTLLVATRNGVVQIWCTYEVPKYVAQFVAIHANNDYVTAMASDSKNRFLFTSLNSGYVKTWYIANFGVGSRRGMYQNIEPSVMSSLKLRFPFLMESFFVGRAEREALLKNPGGPLLVNSYKAHKKSINHIEYIDKQELVVTSSKDKLVRIWTLAGHYVGTIGSPWPCTQKTDVVNKTSTFIVPLDLKREASFTTIKVLMDGINSSLRTPLVWDKLIELRQQREMENKIVKRTLQGKKCPKQPLHDIYYESIETNETSDKDPTFKVEQLKSKVQVFKYLPLYKLATIPKINMFENTQGKSS